MPNVAPGHQVRKNYIDHIVPNCVFYPHDLNRNVPQSIQSIQTIQPIQDFLRTDNLGEAHFQQAMGEQMNMEVDELSQDIPKEPE